VNRLILATTNAGKVIEIRAALGGIGEWSLEPLPPGLPAIEETGDTFLENAIQKARHYSKYVAELTLSDDSGLSVAALGGGPGVHSARYAEDPASRIQRVLREMEPVRDSDRGAVFYCALALARSGKVIWTVQKDVAGVIARSPAGMEGFGYDPVFLLPELHRTMAELTTGEKNRLSARGRALAELRKFLTSL